MFRVCHGREEGLEPLLEPLKRFGLPATMFVETLQCIYFDVAPMQRVVERIRSVPRMDVQLHVHPCWLNFRHDDWARRLDTEKTHDSMAGRGAELKAIVAEACHYFVRVGGSMPLAMRTGNLSVDLNVYAAQAGVGIPLASSVGLAMQPSTDEELRHYGGLFRHHGVVEVPVTSFRAVGIRGGQDKLLTVAGNSLWQLRALLNWAYERQQGPVVILTHASEMADSPGLITPPVFEPLRRNQRRWASLCEYLAVNEERFDVCSFAEAWPRWQDSAQKSMSPYQAGLSAPMSQALAKFGLTN